MIQANIDPKYEILRKLREGGMGAIFLVRHRLLDELRVIKVLRSQLVSDEDLKQRFLREARIAIHLRHPNIAQLYDFSIDDEGTAWIVLEYIDGITLEEYLRQPEARHLPLTLAIAQQGLRALGYLHRKGFVHRDIAPDNLMLTRDVDGEPLVKLIDLGIVKILKQEGKGTATSLYLGKPKYSSPEQLVSQDIDARSDLYSFGVLLYELVTGVYPIHGHDLPSLITGHLHREPVEFSVSDPGNQVPEPLRQVIRDAMAKQRDRRLPSAEDFSRRLAAVAEALSAEQRGESRRLLERASDGAQRERERALDEAEAGIRGRIAQKEFSEARQMIAQAVERLGNDTRLAALVEEIQAREQEQRSAVAESGRLDRMLLEAEAAFEEGDLPEAMSKAFEVLARDPRHTRGRVLQERIDRKRRSEEVAAGATQATVVGVAQTLKSGEVAAAETGPALSPEPEPVAPPAPRPPRPEVHRPEPELDFATATPRTAVPRSGVLRVLALAAVVVALAFAGWYLYANLTTAGERSIAGPPDAEEAYSAGVAALGRGDAAEAARRLREALVADPVERPGYLPQARYGLALAELGDCAQALAAFAASERSGAATRDAIWSEMTAARARCAGGAADPDTIARELERAEGNLSRVLQKLGELRRMKTATPAVADLWQSHPELARREQDVVDLAAEAERALAAARARGDIGQIYEADERSGDALSTLKQLLAEAAKAAGVDLEQINGG